jgi:hypothetical protein
MVADGIREYDGTEETETIPRVRADSPVRAQAEGGNGQPSQEALDRQSPAEDNALVRAPVRLIDSPATPFLRGSWRLPCGVCLLVLFSWL